MSFQSVLGQDQPKQIIANAIKNRNLPHAYLFYGEDSVGKKRLAVELAKALNCAVSGPEDGCGTCPSCKKIERRSHPDFFLLEPAKSSPAAREAIYKIEEIRELRKKLQFLPYEGITKVAIIDSAEAMNAQSANSFLKTLEEPPGQTLLVLITSNPYNLLPTIVSRCQGVRFHALKTDEVRAILEKTREASPESIDSGEIELRAARSRGQVKRALDPETLETSEERNALLNLMGAVSYKKMDAVFHWSKTWSRKPELLQAILDEMLNLLRDLTLIKTGNQVAFLQNKDLGAPLREIAAKKNMAGLVKMFESVQETKQALQANMNSQLALDTMLLNFCEAEKN